jgi:hypothetical protein
VLTGPLNRLPTQGLFLKIVSLYTLL